MIFRSVVTLVISILLIYLAFKIPVLGNDIVYCARSVVTIFALSISLQFEQMKELSKEPYKPSTDK